MGARYQKQTPDASGAGFHSHGVPYPKEDDRYPASANSPFQFAQQSYGSVPPQISGFSDKIIRRNFISKVYAILMVQLLITLVFVVMTTVHEPTKLYIREHPGLIAIGIILAFGILIALNCFDNLCRKSPTNFILLLVFTLAQSFLVAVSVSCHYPEHVFLALGLTILICFALSVFALQTKVDFTVMGGFLLIAVTVLLVVSIVAIFFPFNLMTLLVSSAGAVIFSLYLVYDTQRMMGGEHKYWISPEEYIFAAIVLYLDIINIFLHILQIIGASDND